MSATRRLVVVGNGMAGARLVEEMLARGGGHRYEIVVFGEEPVGNYNRILLSGVLAGTYDPNHIFLNPLPWYARNGVTLHAGVPVKAIDTTHKEVAGADGTVERYDSLVLATGSRPLIPPIDGVSCGPANGRSRDGKTTFKRGVFVFRTLADCDRMLAFVNGVHRAVVIGGGLLGLEAARGLLNAGVDVHVVHLMSHLMDRQLDAAGGRVLQRQLQQMGLHVHLQKATTAVLGDDDVTGLAFEDGSTLECQMLVIAAGIRANVDLAATAGLTVKQGIVVGDDLACEGAPDVYAIGECAEHRGRVYGLVAPLWEQADVLADRLSGKNPHALYVGSKVSTKLQAAGVNVASMGEKDPAEEDDEVVSSAEPARGIYKKLVVRNNRLVGAIVIGDGAVVPLLHRLFSDSTPLPDDRAELLFRASAVASAPPRAVPDTARICDCNGVTKAQIIEAVLRGARSVRAVCEATRAGTGCGSCTPEVRAIVELACEGLVAPEGLAEVAAPPAHVRVPTPADAIVTYKRIERYTRKRVESVTTDTNREKLVVVGNGMAGARVVEEILKRAPNRFDIVMFGAEPYGNYNRILLSNVLNGTQSASDIFMNPLSWYRDNGVTLHAGVKATHIDRVRRMVVGAALKKTAVAYAADAAGDDTAAPVETPYDYVIIATGSRPFVPPMDGFGGPGTFLFRTIDDCDRIADYARASRRAAVIGGGLLGLEAARGLLTHKVEVTVVEAVPQLMMAQLDLESGDILRATIEGMGIRVLSNAVTTRIVRANGRITHLEFKDGASLKTDMVVVSAGIRPITEIATASGLTVDKAIVCDDHMRTSDPAIFALGECVEHRGKTYGLVDPIWEMADVLADVITGTNPRAAYLGSKVGTKLKVMGVELASMGETRSAGPPDEVVVYREPAHGIYKKVVVRDGQIAGAILLGEIENAGTLMQMFMAESPVPARRADLLFGSPTGVSLLNASDLPDNAQICNCNGVSKRQIVEAIQTQGCQSVSKVGACTKAGLGCGSCKGLVAQLLEGCLGKVGYDPTEHYYVPGVPLEKSQLVAEIKNRGLKSVSSVFEELAGGGEDPASKVGLASLLKTLWPDEYVDERDARFINDRVHANIQKDGTFSVVPRIYAGVTTAAELMRIAQVAVKYNVPTVKLTGGQRIDLLGIKKDDLPGVWKDLGMPSGHAYTKAFRTCKSCVGTDFCRYGVGDSIALAQKIERRYQGVESPHKMKLATAGCPRNCSEAYVKDLGAVAVEGGRWEIYLGGAAGGSVRKGDLLCTVTTHDEVLKYMGRFIQYYREHGRYLERTYHFLERIGIDTLRKILVEDSLGLCAHLDADIQKAVDAYVDPWQEAEQPAYHGQFREAELAYALEVVENNG